MEDVVKVVLANGQGIGAKPFRDVTRAGPDQVFRGSLAAVQEIRRGPRPVRDVQ